jgi:phosphoribosyl 1,2-cyclic phosphodiesterase
MRVTFWGARGSSPVVMDHAKSLALLDALVAKARAKGLTSYDELLAAAHGGALGEPLVFGGHTPCTEVVSGEQSFFVDMGTGLREAGTRYLGKRTSYDVFLTHMHWDHLQGLPFFVPVFIPGQKLTIHHVHKTAPEYVRIMFNGVNFPVKWEQLGATIEFKQLTLYEPTKIGGVSVTPFALDHPGGSFGYRFEAGGKAAVIGFDGEYTRVSREDLGKDLPFYQNLDMLVFDAQYELEELLNKHDWGHSSAPIGIDLALREGIKKLVLVHHDPWATDERLRASLANARKYAKANLRWHDNWKGQPDGPEIVSAYDGLTLDV